MSQFRTHVCPVCRRDVAEAGGVEPTFYRHNDKAGAWCPMSGHPVPESNADYAAGRGVVVY